MSAATESTPSLEDLKRIKEEAYAAFMVCRRAYCAALKAQYKFQPGDVIERADGVQATIVKLETDFGDQLVVRAHQKTKTGAWSKNHLPHWRFEQQWGRAKVVSRV